MALTIEIQVSVTGVTDDSFAPLTTLADTGGGLAFDINPATPGQLYILRARRRDDTQIGGCQYSAWSPYVYTRGAWPIQESDMAVEDIAVGEFSSLWVGLESSQGVPTKAQFVLPFLKGGLKRTSGRVYRNAMAGRRTKRRGARIGLNSYKGQVEFEITPEGGFPCLLQAWAPVETTALTGPTRYTNRFPNKYGSKTITLIMRKGNDYFVYPGTRITSLAFTINKTSDSVLTCTADVVALDELVFPLANVPTAATILGTSTATEDTLDAYSDVDALVTIAGAYSPIKSVTFNVNANPGESNVLDGKAGIRGTFDRLADTSGQASLDYENDAFILRDMATVLGAGAFAAGSTLALAPFRCDFFPANNAGGYANTLSFVWPNADITSTEEVTGPDEIPQTLTIAPVDSIGNAAATDFYIEVTHSETNATVTTPGTPIAPANLPVSKSHAYDIGAATAGGTTTVIAGAAGSQLNATTDGIYVGRKLKFLTGTNAGASQIITAYTSATQAFTVGTAFASAPATGDYFMVV